MLLAGGFLLAGFAGYWIAGSAAPQSRRKATEEIFKRERPGSGIVDSKPAFRREDRPIFQMDEEALEQGALVGQRSLIFKDRASMEAFIERAGTKVRLISKLTGLNAIRISFLFNQDLASLLDGTEQVGLIFTATFPEADSVPAQPGAVPIGSGLLSWLGIEGDHSQWGAGVKIAILDTGVSQNSAFGGSIQSIGAAGDLNGHGTAVASMILGNTALVPGVAPGSNVISVLIADSEGRSDSFRIAEGIMAAIDAGAILINISYGSSSDSPILRAAIAAAAEAGVLIVAPTGNSGLDKVFFPAANDGVIAVGGVDKKGEILAFSNTGKSVALAAPGYGLNAGSMDDGAIAVTGTSFSSPIIVGLIAATMSQTGLSAADSWARVYNNLNETGAPGIDDSYGRGLPDMSRILGSTTRGTYDAAVASQWVTTKSGALELQVTVQNRGTETLVNTSLAVTADRGTRNFNITTLPVGEFKTFSMPLGLADGPVQLESRVVISGGQRDARPANNSRVESYTRAQGN